MGSGSVAAAPVQFAVACATPPRSPVKGLDLSRADSLGSAEAAAFPALDLSFDAAFDDEFAFGAAAAGGSARAAADSAPFAVSAPGARTTPSTAGKQTPLAPSSLSFEASFGGDASFDSAMSAAVPSATPPPVPAATPLPVPAATLPPVPAATSPPPVPAATSPPMPAATPVPSATAPPAATPTPPAEMPTPTAPASRGREVLREGGLVVRMLLSSKVRDGCATVTFCYGNDAPTAVADLKAEVAVPRYLTMRLGAPSGTTLAPEPLPGFGPTLPPLTQTLRLSQEPPAPFKPLKVKLKLSYSRGDAKAVENMIVIGPEAFEG